MYNPNKTMNMHIPSCIFYNCALLSEPIEESKKNISFGWMKHGFIRPNSLAAI